MSGVHVFILFLLCFSNHRVKMFNGNAREVLTSKEFKLEAKKRGAKFKLCISDRPFNVMKDKEGTLLQWDKLNQEDVKIIAAAEAAVSTQTATFLSRVSQKTQGHWRQAYIGANLHEQPNMYTIRNAKSVQTGSQAGNVRYPYVCLFVILFRMNPMFMYVSTLRHTMYIWVHFKAKHTSAKGRHFKKTEDFSINNKYDYRHNVIANMPGTRRRTRLEGTDAMCWDNSKYDGDDDDDDDGDEDDEDDEDKNVYSYRPEVHVQEWSALIQRYSKPGDWILDTTAGSASIVAACLRLNRKVFTIELETGTQLFEKSVARAKMAYKFFKQEHMLMALKMSPVSLRTWERDQKSWIQMLLSKLKVRLVSLGMGCMYMRERFCVVLYYRQSRRNKTNKQCVLKQRRSTKNLVMSSGLHRRSRKRRITRDKGSR